MIIEEVHTFSVTPEFGQGADLRAKETTIANSLTAIGQLHDRGIRIVQRNIVRRLTPLECERLMGWPDGWTEHGVTDDGTTVDIAITQRYRICGNGIVSNVTQWLGERLNDITGGVNNG